MGKGKGTGSGRPKKEQPKRMSGTGYDIRTQPGAAAIAQLKYKIQDKQTGLYEIDTKAIQDTVNAYIESNTHITIDKDTGTETVAQSPISRVGLRIALGISRETYNEWLLGYVDKTDIDNEEIKPNIALAAALRAGDDTILQYLVETCDKYGDTKRIRLLETYGEIGPAQSKTTHDVNINLGKHQRYSK